MTKRIKTKVANNLKVKTNFVRQQQFISTQIVYNVIYDFPLSVILNL